ncbi:CvpA family protein [Mesonia sp. MT50]|uniref:CvpA family protein n=1 Tax=Mesonia profundi TaxID=3070998 RepID=A0ABU0ZXX1_9FLAO|nr:CvpA family protein [Mesonia profundi]MDQ7916150.1 CvpA family protein [Mesonia profundi]
MNVIDIVLGIILLLGLIRGFMKGFIIELASLVALILGIYGAIHFSHFAFNFLHHQFDWEEQYIQLTAFAVTFILIVLFILLIGKLLTKLVGVIALGIVNRILGGAFGLLKAVFITSAILMFIASYNDHAQFVKEETLEESILYEPIKVIAPVFLPQILNKVDETMEENNLK